MNFETLTLRDALRKQGADSHLPVARLDRALFTALWTIVCFSAALYWGRATNLLVVTALAATCSLVGAVFLGSLRRLDLVLSGTIADSSGPNDFALRLLKNFASGGAAGAALTLLTHLAFALVTPWLPSIRTEAHALYGLLEGNGPIAFTLPLLSWVVLVEEVVWRGIVFPAVRRKGSASLGLLVATGLYCVPQLFSGSWLLPVVALAFGFVWTAQRALGARLTTVLVTHLTWDIGMFYLFPLTLDG